jgi:hypothetical protein
VLSLGISCSGAGTKTASENVGIFLRNGSGRFYYSLNLGKVLKQKAAAVLTLQGQERG